MTRPFHIYEAGAVRFTDYFVRSTRSCRRLVSSEYRDLDGQVLDYLDAQHHLASLWIGIFGRGLYSEHVSDGMLFNAFQSNLFHLRSARELARNGLVGSAFPILRLVLEGQIYAKYMAISRDPTLFQRWANGDARMSIRNDAMNKVRSPNLARLIKLWSELCNFTHFSIHSGQPNIRPPEVKLGIGLTYTIVCMLLLNNYHLLNRQLINPTVEYYVRKYGKYNEFRSARMECRKLRHDIAKGLSPEGKRVVSDFASRWVVKPP